MNGLRITFLNVGYGEAILLEYRQENERFTALIDGGSADPLEFADSGSGRLMAVEYLERVGIDRVDWMFNTHIHEDHTSGLAACARRFCPRVLYQTLPPNFYESLKVLQIAEDRSPTEKKFLTSVNDYRSMCQFLHTSGSEIRKLDASFPTLTPAALLTIRVLAPVRKRASELPERLLAISEADSSESSRKAANRADAAMNNYSLMLMLEYAGRRILLPGDTNCHGYGHLNGVSLQADVFKVGHHGQNDGISRELFRRIHPEYVVCCASSDRRYGSAAPEILTMMKEEGAELTFSDCPDVPGLTDNLKPHHALVYEITESGSISFRYEI